MFSLFHFKSQFGKKKRKKKRKKKKKEKKRKYKIEWSRVALSSLLKIFFFFSAVVCREIANLFL